MNDLRGIELEVRLFRAVVDGSPEIRAHVLRKFPSDCFIHLRDAWQLVIDKIGKDKPISLDLLRLNGELDAVQRGLVESLPNVPLYTDKGDLDDLMKPLLADYERKRLRSGLRPILQAIRNRKKSAKDIASEILGICQDLTVEFAQNDGISGIGAGQSTKTIVDAIFSNHQVLAPLGYAGFDDRCGGLGQGDLVVINATSGSGKTAFMLNCAAKMAERGHPVGFCSLELPKGQIWKRIAANICHIPFGILRNQHHWTDKLKCDVAARLQEWHDRLLKVDSCLNVHDDPQMKVADVYAAVAGHHYHVVFIDYLNLITEGEGERWERLGDLARRLKLLARSLGIAVVIAVQKDEATGKIRYAREIKEHADIVLGWDNADEDPYAETRIITIQVEKGRNIPQFAFELLAEFEFMRLEDLSPVSAIGNAASEEEAEEAPTPEGGATLAYSKIEFTRRELR